MIDYYALKKGGVIVRRKSKTKSQWLRISDYQFSFIAKNDILIIERIFYMTNDKRVLAGLFVIFIMGSIGNLQAAENTSIEETISDKQEGANCLQDNGPHIEVIKLNYVKAEDVARVLAPLFSESARIIPYKPGNSLMIKDRRRFCKERD